MNRIAAIIFKVLFWAVILMDVAAVAIISSYKWISHIDLESSMLDTPGYGVVILVYFMLALSILASVAISILCRLSRKKWAIVVGIILSLVAAGSAGFYAITLAILSLKVITAVFTSLSVAAALLAYSFKRRLASHIPLETPDTWHVLRKPIWITLALVPVIAAVWLTDETLDPNFDRFYTDHHRIVLDKDNAAVGLAGLDAPVGADFMAVGLVVFKNAQLNLISPQSKVQTTKAKNKIEFVGSREELDCWTDIPESAKDAPRCASEKRLNEILRANATLLDRYWQVARTPHFQGYNPNGNLFLMINRLIAADVQLKLRHGSYEDAYQEWWGNYRFLSRMISSDVTWIDKAVFCVADGFSLESAESLIHTYKGIATLHGDELLDMLEHGGMARWNLAGLMRAEYDLHYQLTNILNTQIWFHPNFIRNRMLHSAQDYLMAIDSPPSLVADRTLAVLRENGGLNSWTNDYLRDPMNTFIVRGLLLNLTPHTAVGLLKPMYIHDARRRALTSAVLIKRRGLKDDEIAKFLASVGPELKNPLTGDPMSWDAKKRVIRFVNPKAGIKGEDVNMDVKL